MQELEANYGRCPIAHLKAENVQALGQNAATSVCALPQIPPKMLKLITRCCNSQNSIVSKAQKVTVPLSTRA